METCDIFEATCETNLETRRINIATREIKWQLVI